MSLRIDNDGNHHGAYTADDLNDFLPDQKPRSRKIGQQRVLHYQPIWSITEMQVKLGVRAKIPNPIGALTIELAQQISPAVGGESRSRALEKDIEIVAAATVQPRKTRERPDEATEDSNETLDDVFGADGAMLVDDLVAQHHQILLGSPTSPHQRPRPSPSAEEHPRHRQPAPSMFSGHRLQSKQPLSQSRPQGISHNPPTVHRSSSSSDFSRPDGRRREGKHLLSTIENFID
jgi:hypothetical protein